MIQKFKLKNIKKNIYEPFAKEIINFLVTFSKEIRKTSNYSKFPDLYFLSLWLSEKNLRKLKKKQYTNCVGRGLVFHISPNNMPTNFFYSFILGLLSGNSNIVKLPNKNFYEIEVLLKIFNNLTKTTKYKFIKKSNFFVKMSHDNPLIEQISKISDARMIWGGDNNIEYYKKISSATRCIDLVFSDRYSISIVNINNFKKLHENEISILANKFFIDTMISDQNACNSPHVIFWIGKNKNKENLKKMFWSEFLKILIKKYNFENININEKYNKLTKLIISNKYIKKLHNFKNFLYILEVDKKITDINTLRGKNGMFFCINLENFNEIKKFINKKTQTLTNFGFNEMNLINFIKKNSLLGIDQIAPFGKGMQFDNIWDGYNIINFLSREIGLKNNES